MPFSPNALAAKTPYFYSDSHILGCVFAILGLMLHSWLELAALQWYVVAMLAYLIGSFSFNHKKTVLQSISPKADGCAALNHLILKNKAFLPDDAIDLLMRISVTIGKILPKLESHPDMQREVYTVRKIIEEYLPVTLACYIKIPTQNAGDAQTKNTSAQPLLIEQLALLDRYLTEIFKNLLDEDMKALIINGRFLKEKFTRNDGFNI